VVGGVGALGLRLGEGALAGVLVEGAMELRAPEAVRVAVGGKPARHVGAWDVAKAVAAALDQDLDGRVVEFRDPPEGWSVEFRSSLCGILGEMGALAALVAPDGVTGAHYEARGITLDENPAPGSGAYAREIRLDLADVGPVAGPGYNEPAGALAARAGEPVDGVFLGSCYGGGLDDLAVAAEILRKAGRIDPAVRLTISPATLEVARAALNAGYYEAFFGAGAIVAAPGMGVGNVGGGAILGEGEHLASTAAYHRPAGPGQASPTVTLVSPAAAAAAAVAGKLIDPAEFTS
jgi:3-isopropylmalate/(R)-2-methylmalate dehydratase large subunit